MNRRFTALAAATILTLATACAGVEAPDGVQVAGGKLAD
jgi:hypothetical protein